MVWLGFLTSAAVQSDPRWDGWLGVSPLRGVPRLALPQIDGVDHRRALATVSRDLASGEPLPALATPAGLLSDDGPPTRPWSRSSAGGSKAWGR